MNGRLTNVGVQDFLEDFKNHATTTIVEQGSERDEIIQIARAKGIDLTRNTDLAGFKTVYTFATIANGNGARIPQELLLRALPTMIGKPVNIDHIRNYVVGYYLDYRYIAKEQKVIAYGIFFKSNFGKEWAEARELFKSGLLATSHEIWCPKNRRRYLSDGTYEMMDVEIAGGGLMYKEKPAHKNCNVLELAKLHMENNHEDLVMASLEKKNYQAEDLIVSNSSGEQFRQANIQQISAVAQQITEQRNAPAPIVPDKVDFNLRCPESGTSNWKVIEDTGDYVKVMNLDSKKTYGVEMQKPTNQEAMDKLSFLFEATAICPQCNYGMPFSVSSKVKNCDLTCKKCEMQYSIDIDKLTKKRQVKRITEVKDSPAPIASSEQGGQQTMNNQPVVKELFVSCQMPEDVEKNLEVASKDVTENVAIVPETVNLDTASQEAVIEQKPAEEVVEPTTELEQASLLAGETIETVPGKEIEQKLDKANYQIGMYRKAIRKAVKKIREMKKSTKLEKASLDAKNLEIAKIQQEANEKIEFYKADATKVVRRRDELGKFGEALSDKDIANDDKYAKAKLDKENALLKAGLEKSSVIVGDKNTHNSDAFSKAKAEIDRKAFEKR